MFDPRALIFGALLVATPALAGGSTGQPTPDFGSLAPGAEVRPDNPNGKPHQALVRLLADRAPLEAGETFGLGVELVPDAGWHGYWKSPGDIGMPLTVTWHLPDGTEIGEVEFPYPHRFDQSGIVSYGYEEPVLVLAEATLPADLPAGAYEITADAEWLVCEATCIPGEASLKLPVEVVDTNGASEPTPWANLFDWTRAHHPVHMTEVADFGIEHALSQSAFRPGDEFQVAFLLTPTSDKPVDTTPEVATWPTFVPIFDSFQFFVYETSLTPMDNGGVLVVMKGDALEVETLPESSSVGALFQVKVGDEWVRTEYTTPVTWVAQGTEVAKSTSPLWALAAGNPTPEPAEARAPQAPAQSGSLPVLLLMALAGGMLLNVMPCVFPVITLKIFGLVSHAESTGADRRKSALAYTLGILVSFWALAAAVLIAKATIGGVGWGFQFQSPGYVAALSTIVFVFGLSLFGVFEIPVFGADTAAEAGAKGGLAGDFFNGVFATLLATPCSAPFLGPAIGFAFTQSNAVIVLFFSVIGLGLALPFAAVASIPALMRFMPSPGPWMETFKHLLGFTLMATTVWLVGVLAGQIGTDRAIGFLAFLGTASVGAWIFGRWGDVAQTRQRQLGAFAVAVLVTIGGAFQFLDLDFAEEEECDDTVVSEVVWHEDEIPWQDFSEANVAALAGTPLFIDFTADWCLTCKVNEKTVINTSDVRGAMERHGVVPLVADWTRRDPEITEWLRRYGRAGVPFYLVIPADPAAEPIPLPEVLTPSMIVDALERAAART